MSAVIHTLTTEHFSGRAGTGSWRPDRCLRRRRSVVGHGSGNVTLLGQQRGDGQVLNGRISQCSMHCPNTGAAGHRPKRITIAEHEQCQYACAAVMQLRGLRSVNGCAPVVRCRAGRREALRSRGLLRR